MNIKRRFATLTTLALLVASLQRISNADTGAELWAFDPKAYEDGQPPNGTGFVHRGVAAWRDTAAGALRIFVNSRCVPP